MLISSNQPDKPGQFTHIYSTFCKPLVVCTGWPKPKSRHFARRSWQGHPSLQTRPCQLQPWARALPSDNVHNNPLSKEFEPNHTCNALTHSAQPLSLLARKWQVKWKIYTNINMKCLQFLISCAGTIHSRWDDRHLVFLGTQSGLGMVTRGYGM